MSVSKVRITVCGSQYILGTEDGEQYVQELAKQLDEDMGNVLTECPTASVTSAAVLVAMDYLDRLNKATSGADNMRGQIKDYLEDAAKAKLSAEEARREVERLRRELQYLKEQKSR